MVKPESGRMIAEWAIRSREIIYPLGVYATAEGKKIGSIRVAWKKKRF
jgi:hypothetical protein